MSAWHIIKKDLTILTRDRRTLVLLLAMPLILIAILGFSSGKLLVARHQLRLTLTIVNQDKSPLSQNLIKTLGEDARIDLEEVNSLETARARIRHANRAAAVLIGPAFSSAAEQVQLIDLLDFPTGRFSQGLKGFDIHIYPRSIMPWSRDAIEQVLFYKALNVVVPYTIDRFALIKAYVDSYRAKYPAQSVEKAPSSDNSFFAGLVPSSDAIYRTIVPSYAVMFAFFLINIMAYSFVSERNRGTLLRIQASPIPIPDLIAGKTVPFLLISIVQGFLLIGAGHLLFSMPLGSSPWMLLPLIVCTSVAATTLGLLVATLVRNETQISSLSTLLVIALAAVSGCLMPRDWMPSVMQEISLYVAPQSWSLIGYSEVLSAKQPDFTRVLLCCVMLLLFSLFFLLLGLWRFTMSPQETGESEGA